MRWPWASRRKLLQYLDDQQAWANEYRKLNEKRRPPMQVMRSWLARLKRRHRAGTPVVERGPFVVAGEFFKPGGFLDTLPSKYLSREALHVAMEDDARHVVEQMAGVQPGQARNDTNQPERVAPWEARCRLPLADVWRYAVEEDPGILCRLPRDHVEAHEWRSDVDWVKWDAQPRQAPAGEEGADP